LIEEYVLNEGLSESESCNEFPGRDAKLIFKVFPKDKEADSRKAEAHACKEEDKGKGSL
jgi:hypothetical protein